MHLNAELRRYVITGVDKLSQSIGSTSTKTHAIFIPRCITSAFYIPVDLY